MVGLCISVGADDDDGDGNAVDNGWQWQGTTIMKERILSRGMKVFVLEGSSEGSAASQCDAAILLQKDGIGEGTRSSCLKRNLLPGGILWVVTSLEGTRTSTDTTQSSSIKKSLADYSDSIWDVNAASEVYSSETFKVISISKRTCAINSWSCPWMDKEEKIQSQLPDMNESDGYTISTDDTYLDYERKVACAATISPSVAERTRAKIQNTDDKLEYATVLTDANIHRATAIMQQHGFVVIKGLLPSSQTIPWGEAVLSDFQSACARLKCHPTRPVDLLNPHTTDSSAGEERAFEPLSYKEMAMREDLRVDLRSGPEMEALRGEENELAMKSVKTEAIRAATLGNDVNDGPSILDSDCAGSVASWRFHPSILSIIRSVFNPQEESLYKGNFGRWNFGGSGPNGSPQPLRLGQVGSVLSCPGSGDQAIHADTPHLFEHLDCLPCHYLNVFTPGYKVIDDPNSCCYRNEFKDGIWTGNTTIGGTVVVNGSHKLSITGQLLAEDDEANDNDALIRRQLLQLRTLRPALDTGDVLFFDCRTIHYGLANTSQGDTKGNDMNAGRRPMLYLNVSQSWFHDPKNWDNMEKIF